MAKFLTQTISSSDPSIFMIFVTKTCSEQCRFNLSNNNFLFFGLLYLVIPDTVTYVGSKILNKNNDDDDDDLFAVLYNVQVCIESPKIGSKRIVAEDAFFGVDPKNLIEKEKCDS